MVDLILATLAILALIAYFLPLILSVYGPALVAVLILVVVLAAYDFMIELRGNKSK